MSLGCVWQWGGKLDISSKHSMTHKSEKCPFSGRKTRKGGNSSMLPFLQQCPPTEIKDFGHPGSMRFKFPSSIWARFGYLLNLPLDLRISGEPNAKVYPITCLPAAEASLLDNYHSVIVGLINSFTWTRAVSQLSWNYVATTPEKAAGQPQGVQQMPVFAALIWCQFSDTTKFYLRWSK